MEPQTIIYSIAVPPEVIAAIRSEFANHVVQYSSRGRFPSQPRGRGENGRPLCTGCHKEVPKYRRSWCSNKCYERYVPQCVCRAVANRDKGICQGCGIHIETAAKNYPPPPHFDYWKARDKYPDGNLYESPEWKDHKHQSTLWRRGKIVEEYDHIIPFSEGGLTIVENLRTLCSPCHRERTRQWHGERKQRKAA